MSVTRWVLRRCRRVAIVAAGVAVFASGLPGAAGPTSAAGAQASAARTFEPCPEAFPVDDLAPGIQATGLTVEQGTAPDEFGATVLGVLADGVAPGIDMVIVETASPAIERAGGVWQGMSGSPVYASDGRLIGAIAYSLGVPSTIAGITPAADMQALLDRPTAVPRPSLQPAATVALPAALQWEVIARGAATVVEAAVGLRPLPVPLGVSGVHQAHLDEAAERLAQQIPGARVHAGGAAPVDRPGSGSEIFPGSNFATTISYGDITVSAVGTTTAVCPAGPGGSDGLGGLDRPGGPGAGGGEQVLAFGHPLGWQGATTLSAHPASAVYVQPDPVLGPFKQANLGGVTGTVDQDRLVGVRALVGPTPATAEVRSTITATDDGVTRSGTTRVNVQTFLAGIAADHLTGALDHTADRLGAGSSEVRWAITGTRSSGEPFTVDVTNRYADQADISSVSATDLLGQLAVLETNRFEDVRVTGVDLTGSVSGSYTQYTLDAVLVRQPDGTYAPPPDVPAPVPVQVVAGGTLDLRVVLEPYQGDGEVREVDLSLEVPTEAAGAFGEVRIAGGAAGAGPPVEPVGFDDLLAQMHNLVPNNAVTATLALDGLPPTGAPPTTRATADRIVSGERSLLVEVIAAP